MKALPLLHGEHDPPARGTGEVAAAFLRRPVGGGLGDLPTDFVNG